MAFTDADPDLEPWRWQPRLDYMQEQRTKLAAKATVVAPFVQQGDFAGAREALASTEDTTGQPLPQFADMAAQLRAKWTGSAHEQTPAWADPKFAGQTIGADTSGTKLPDTIPNPSGQMIQPTSQEELAKSRAKFGKTVGLGDLAKAGGEAFNELSSAPKAYGVDVAEKVGVGDVPVLNDTVNTLVSPIGLASLGAGAMGAAGKATAESAGKSALLSIGKAVAKNWGEQAALTAGGIGASEGVTKVPGFEEQPVALQSLEQIVAAVGGGVAAHKALPLAGGAAKAVPRAVNAVDDAMAARTGAVSAEQGAVRADLGIPDIVKRVDPITLLSKGYGELLQRLPVGRERGFGSLPKFITDAPDLYDEAGMLNFKAALDETPGLPLSAKVSNAFWKTLGVGSERARLRIDDPRAYYVRKLYETNDAAIRSIATTQTEMIARPGLGDLPRDPKGYALTPTGATVNLINDSGTPLLTKAGWVDILEHPERYPDAMAGISPERMAAIKAASANLETIRAASEKMGIDVGSKVATTGDGVYLPRGRPEPVALEAGPRRRLGDSYQGREAGSTQGRKFASQGAGIEAGNAYPDPLEAYQQAIAENLRQQNAQHAADLLKQIEVDKHGTIGAAVLPDAVTTELGELRPQIKAISKELRGLKGRQAVADRDARLAGDWIEAARDRVRDLYETGNAQGTAAAERTLAAREALATARTAMDDSLSVAAELARKLPGAGKGILRAQQNFDEMVAEAQSRSSRLNALSDQMAAAESAAEPSRATLKGIPDTVGTDAAPSRAAVTEALDQMRFVTKLRQEVYAEAARVDAEISALPFDDSRAALTDAQGAARETKRLLAGSLGDVRRQAIEGQAVARVEGKSSLQTRIAMANGRMKELERAVEQRRATVIAAVDKSTELGAQIARLADELEPLTARRKELLQQVKHVRVIARDRATTFDGVIGLDQMRGVRVPLSLANSFNKAIRESAEKGPVSAVFDLINDGMRMFGATADVSRQATVGLIGAFDNPAYAKSSFGAGIAEAKNPGAVWTRLKAMEARHPDLPGLAEAVGKDGLDLGIAGENSVAASGMARLGQLPVLRQADALYSAPGVVDRYQRYQGLLQEWKAAGKDYTSGQARASAANIANLVTGRARSGVLKPVFGEGGSNRIAFAGRFVQSQFEMVANAILVGGVEGTEARKSIGRLVAGGTAIMAGYNAFAEATGQDFMPWNEFLDPTSSNFMRVRIAGRDISIFGPWDSLVKGVAKTASGDPNYFARTKLAPLAGLAYSAIGVDTPIGQIGGGGENAIGQPLGWKDVAPIPFGARDIGETAANTDYTDPTAIGALLLTVPTALAGIKNAPESPYEQWNGLAQDKFGKDAAELDGDQERALIAAHQSEYAAYQTNKSGKAKQYTDRKEQAVTAQNGRDGDLLGGTVTIQQWADANKASKIRLDEAASQIFGSERREPRTAWEHYLKTIHDSTRNEVTDWDSVNAWLGQQSAADQAFIESKHADPPTPLTKVARAVRDAYYGIAKYAGYTADQGSQIDRIVAQLKASAGRFASNDAYLLRALTALPNYAQLDPRVASGVRRAITGSLSELPLRERYAKAHPEVALVTGRGTLTPEQVKAIKALLGE